MVSILGIGMCMTTGFMLTCSPPIPTACGGTGVSELSDGRGAGLIIQPIGAGLVITAIGDGDGLIMLGVGTITGTMILGIITMDGLGDHLLPVIMHAGLPVHIRDIQAVRLLRRVPA